MFRRFMCAAVIVGIFPGAPASANNVGENAAWQFKAAAERSAEAYLEEMRQRRRNGYYSAPVYNTHIDNQYNCAVNSTATGNDSAANAVANSPSTSGHTSDATGNASDSSYMGGGVSDGSSAETTQENAGSVSAATRGGITTNVRGDNFQALNTDQTNSGNQSATVNGSTACQYAAAG